VPETDTDAARRYHDPRYRAIFADLGLGLAFLAFVALTEPGHAAARLVDPLPEALGAFVLGGLVVAGSALVRLPLSVWLGLTHERAFGFSRQTWKEYALDRVKSVGIGAVLTGAGMAGLVGAAVLFPSWWPLVASVGAAVLVLLLSFVAPIVLEPVFNRFAPLEDSELRDAVLRLADDARVPVREVLVADASKRTTKVNAYVSGLGATGGWCSTTRSSTRRPRRRCSRSWRTSSATGATGTSRSALRSRWRRLPVSCSRCGRC